MKPVEPVPSFSQTSKKPNFGLEKSEESVDLSKTMPKAKSAASTKSPEEKLSNYISDVFKITLNSKERHNKTFIKEFEMNKVVNGKQLIFIVDDVDDYLMARIKLHSGENNFVYLYDCLKELYSHPMLKVKMITKEVIEPLEDIIYNQMSLLYAIPETFDI